MINELEKEELTFGLKLKIDSTNLDLRFPSKLISKLSSNLDLFALSLSLSLLF